MPHPRSSGLLLHITSLPSRHGIGDLGPEAYQFADFLASAGQTIWQVLPLVPTGYGYSPYAAPSTYAGNPLLISPDRLLEDGWLTRDDIDENVQFEVISVLSRTTIKIIRIKINKNVSVKIPIN